MSREQFGGVADFAPVAAMAFGAGRRLAEVRRLRGGSKKGVYRLGFDDGNAVVGYVWSEAENYWAAAPRPAAPRPAADDQASPFSDATGAGLFATAHSLLASLGVRVPELYLLDQSRNVFPADVALVEWVPGESLEARLDSAEPGARDVVRRLRESLDVMHGHRHPNFGKIGFPTAGGSCEQVVLELALAHLAEAADRLPRIDAVRPRLEQRLREFAADIAPRSEYGLIHGELGPDHVRVDALGRPVLIDIEGLMYFDVEWEHVFLEMRFKRHYELLRASQLDERRLRLYRLAEHLSLVAGPLRMADTDFPERDFMVEIAMSHADRVLGYVPLP